MQKSEAQSYTMNNQQKFKLKHKKFDEPTPGNSADCLHCIMLLQSTSASVLESSKKIIYAKVPKILWKKMILW